ncbi:MAG: O-antigen ligase family protein [bacterium]
MIPFDAKRIVRYCDIAMEVGLIVFAFSIPTSVSGQDVGKAIAVLAWFIKMGLKRDFEPSRFPLNLEVGLLIVALLLSFPGAINVVASLKKFVVVIGQLSIFFIVISSLTRISQIKRILVVLILATALEAIYTIFQYNGYSIRTLGYSGRGGRVVGTLGMYNSVGGVMGMVIPVIIALLLFVRDVRVRVLGSVALVSALISLFLSSTRGAWIGVAASVSSMAILKTRRAIIGVLAVVVFFAVIFPSLPDRMADRIASIINPDDNVSRIKIWRDTLLIIDGSGFFGVGLDNYGRGYDRVLPDKKHSFHAHNTALNLMAEVGILGLTAFIYLVIHLLMKGWRVHYGGMGDDWLRGISMGVIGGIVNYSVHSMVDYTFSGQVFHIFCLLAGIILSVEHNRMSEGSGARGENQRSTFK